MSEDYSIDGRLRSPSAKMIHLGIRAIPAITPEEGWNPLGIHSSWRNLPEGMICSGDSFLAWGETADRTLHVTVEYDKARDPQLWGDDVRADIIITRNKLHYALKPWERLIDYTVITDARDWSEEARVYLAGEEELPLISEPAVQPPFRAEKLQPFVTPVVTAHGNYDVSTARMWDNALETVIFDTDNDRFAEMSRCFLDRTAHENHLAAVALLRNSQTVPALAWKNAEGEDA